MKFVESVQELEQRLATPNTRDLDSIRRIEGDIIILGAGGKMGPSLARRIKRAVREAGTQSRVLAVSRFSSPDVVKELNRDGIETLTCDLLNRDEVTKLPLCPNVLFLSGRKFGSTDRPDLTWTTNTIIPAHTALHYRASRIVVFSTGNVYPLMKLSSGGSLETDTPGPIGEYAQSCVGRERVFEYHSHEYGTPCLLFRLNYAVDLRYGVLVDIARQVYARQLVDLAVPAFNAIWQGDANSYALRCLEYCTSPPCVMNVTGPETISVRRAAEYFAREFRCDTVFSGEESDRAFFSNASLCHALFGYPEVSLGELLQWVTHWVKRGGESLNKPTHFAVADGRY
ncbi:MAG: NAD-dependent epimerase/dehydratase family protein [Terriglobia bacterium]